MTHANDALRAPRPSSAAQTADYGVDASRASGQDRKFTGKIVKLTFDLAPGQTAPQKR